MARHSLTLTKSNLSTAISWVQRAAELGWRMEVKEPKRSDRQNDRMWKMLTCVSKNMTISGMKYSPDQWKCIFMKQMGKEVSFLPTLDGQSFFPTGFRSSDLSKKEMTDVTAEQAKAVVSPMRSDRELAIKAMQSMGWTVLRFGTGKKASWRFTRPDTGGLWGRIDCKQVNLSMNWVVEMAMRYDDAPDLMQEIEEAKERWRKKRFMGIYSRADITILAASSQGGAE